MVRFKRNKTIPCRLFLAGIHKLAQLEEVANSKACVSNPFEISSFCHPFPFSQGMKESNAEKDLESHVPGRPSPSHCNCVNPFFLRMPFIRSHIQIHIAVCSSLWWEGRQDGSTRFCSFRSYNNIYIGSFGSPAVEQPADHAAGDIARQPGRGEGGPGDIGSLAEPVAPREGQRVGDGQGHCDCYYGATFVSKQLLYAHRSGSIDDSFILRPPPPNLA